MGGLSEIQKKLSSVFAFYFDGLEYIVAQHITFGFNESAGDHDAMFPNGSTDINAHDNPVACKRAGTCSAVA